MNTSTPEEQQTAERRQGGWFLLVAGPVTVIAGLIAGLTNITS